MVTDESDLAKAAYEAYVLRNRFDSEYRRSIPEFEPLPDLAREPWVRVAKAVVQLFVSDLGSDLETTEEQSQ